MNVYLAGRQAEIQKLFKTLRGVAGRGCCRDQADAGATQEGDSFSVNVERAFHF